MGASLPPRNNPFRAQGLMPGIPLRVEVHEGREVKTFATQVEAVQPEHITVLVPMHRLQKRPLPGGAILRCEYFYRGRRWWFATESLGAADDGATQLLAMPAGIQDADRRDYYRLPTAITPLSVYRLVVTPAGVEPDEGQPDHELACTIVDLSEGGLCLSSRTPATVGEWLGLHADLSQAGEVHARMRVVGVDPPRPGNRNSRIHCIFVDIGLSDRDRIARYLLRRQLEMRRRGQL